MLKRCHNYPKLIFNEAQAYTTDTAYRIRTKPGAKVPGRSLVARFVNSATALSAELEGRHYGGGVLELVPSEIERVLIPNLGEKDLDLNGLDRRIRNGRDNGAAAALLRERDRIVLSMAGISPGEQDLLHEGWIKLKTRRHRERPLERETGEADGSEEGQMISAAAE